MASSSVRSFAAWDNGYFNLWLHHTLSCSHLFFFGGHFTAAKGNLFMGFSPSQKAQEL